MAHLLDVPSLQYLVVVTEYSFFVATGCPLVGCKCGWTGGTAMDSVRGNGAKGLKCDASTPLNPGTCCSKTTKQIVSGAQKMSWRWCRTEPKTEPPECTECDGTWMSWSDSSCVCGKGSRTRSFKPTSNAMRECANACNRIQDQVLVLIADTAECQHYLVPTIFSCQ